MLRSFIAKRAWLFLWLAVVALYCYGLGRAPLLGPDEPRYAQVAREMFWRGDFVTPTLGGRTWFEKPALLYWLMMASYRLFGVTEYAARFGSALSGVLTIGLVGWLAVRVERASVGGERRGFGLVSAGVMASSLGLIVFSRGATFDIVLTASVTLALVFFFAADITPSEKSVRPLMAGFYAAMGVALIAKGLIGVVIPAGVAALYLLFQWRRPDLRKLGVWWGPLLTLLIAALWYAPVIARHRYLFVDQFFVQHHFARYVSNKYRHPQPFYFYFLVILLLILPWTLVLIRALADTRRWHWRGHHAADRARVFALAWTVFPIAFFSLSGSKLPGYILPSLPGAALLIGDCLTTYLRDGKQTSRALPRIVRATGMLMIAVAAGGGIYAAKTNIIDTGCSLLIVAPLIIGGALTIWGAVERRALSVAAIAGAVLAAIALIVTCGFGRAANRESARDLLLAADARGYGQSLVINLRTTERSAEFYAANRVLYNEHGEPLKAESPSELGEMLRLRAGDKRTLVFTPSGEKNRLLDDANFETEEIGDNGHVALIAARVNDQPSAF